mmetsp:Transcript_32328/g.113759  ORF Transcript_32328/g.113759 Transcript_32328/m.113759 type:complete len:235 (-) Transcript_32328:712-1416(-)
MGAAAAKGRTAVRRQRHRKGQRVEGGPAATPPLSIAADQEALSASKSRRRRTPLRGGACLRREIVVEGRFRAVVSRDRRGLEGHRRAAGAWPLFSKSRSKQRAAHLTEDLRMVCGGDSGSRAGGDSLRAYTGQRSEFACPWRRHGGRTPESPARYTRSGARTCRAAPPSRPRPPRSRLRSRRRPCPRRCPRPWWAGWSHTTFESVADAAHFAIMRPSASCGKSFRTAHSTPANW